jgi:ABC-2 type transport system permease protein
MTGATFTSEPNAVRGEVSTGRVFLRTCSAEWTRLWSVRSTWWFLVAATVVMVGLGTALGFEAAADPVELHGEPAWTTAQYIAMPAQFALLGLALTAVTSDYATGGIVPVLQWTPRRAVFFAARTLVTVAAATSLGVLLAAASGVLAFATAGSAFTLQPNDGLDMAATVGFVVAAGTMIAVGLGFMLRNTAGTLIGVFLLIVVLPLLLPLFGDGMSTLAQVLPGSGAIFLLFGDLPGMTKQSSVITLLAWAAGTLLVGWSRLMRDDAQ